MRRLTVGRRAFLSGLAGLGVLGAGGALAACADRAPGAPGPGAAPPPTPAPGSSAPPTTTPTTPEWTGDARAVALLASLSALAADLYTEAATAAGQGRFGTLPGAVSALVTGAGSQHAEHLAVWNQVLVAAGLPTVDAGGDGLRVAARFRDRLAAARAPVELAGLAADLEDVASATATAVLGGLTDPPAIVATAGIAPVAAMRAATAAYLLGRPPAVPGDPLAGALGTDALVG